MRIVVTAGPTREAMDAVRFISNRSSGKMGYAVARRAVLRGHKTVLVTGPVSIRPPGGLLRLVRVVTAGEMLKAVRREVRHCDALVMAAAVADWRPARASRGKLKKRGTPARRLRLVPTPDVLKSVAGLKRGRVFVGFAAETGNVLAEARRKLREKRLDLVVANDVSRPDSGFDVDTNKVWFVPASGGVEDLPVMSKRRVAGRIVAWIEERAGRRGATGCCRRPRLSCGGRPRTTPRRRAV